MRKLRLLTMEKGDNCLLFSIAMVLGMDPDLVQLRIGHDGMQDVGGTKPRAYHLQEIVDVALSEGYAMTPIEAFPAARIPGRQDDFEIIFPGGNEARFIAALKNRQGIIAGRTKNCGHAVAWDGDQVYDPRGRKYPLFCCAGQDFEPHTFWMISKIKT